MCVDIARLRRYQLHILQKHKYSILFGLLKINSYFYIQIVKLFYRLQNALQMKNKVILPLNLSPSQSGITSPESVIRMSESGIIGHGRVSSFTSLSIDNE